MTLLISCCFPCIKNWMTQAAIWHCLNHYAYHDATFLAERLLDEADTDESIFLAATCHYR